MLSSQLQNANVIIFPLEQPNRYDFAMQCACGFQHHGFKNENTSKGDQAEDMRSAARSHLIQKHGVDPAKVNDFFSVLKETHPGGIDHAALKAGIAAKKFTVLSAVKPPVEPPVPVAAAKPATPPAPVQATPTPGAPTPKPIAPSVPATVPAVKAAEPAKPAPNVPANTIPQVQTGGVNK